MIRSVVLGAALVVLAGCGGSGGGGVQATSGGRVVGASANVALDGLPFAQGVVSRACMGSDRRARNAALCGCAQAVANRHLTAADQRLIPRFYTNPSLAQDIRQSGTSRNSQFWTERYRPFLTDFERTCRPARS